MKRIIQIIILIFVTDSFAQTNVYHPFPDSNATWNVAYRFLPCSVDPSARYTYYFGNDTLINALTYHSIYEYGIVYPNACTAGGPLGYKGAIRQDTTLRKVFVILAGDLNEKILYDFNLNNIGDTVIMSCPVLSFCLPIIVIYIDSIEIDGQYRKRFE